MAPITSARRCRKAPPGKATRQGGGSLPWRQQFLDPALQQLIATALENNRDLRLAALNVEAYEARYRIQRAAQLPTLAANGSGTRQQGSDDLSSTGQGTISSQYGANIGITSYELDLFYGSRASKIRRWKTIWRRLRPSAAPRSR